MAAYLPDAGNDLFTSLIRSPLPEEPSATVLDASAVAAETVDTVITVLPDTPDVMRVLPGANGVSARVLAGKRVMDMSSISPIETARISDTFAELGIDFDDVPDSGGEVGAKAASLSIMCGGTQAAIDRAFIIRTHEQEHNARRRDRRCGPDLQDFQSDYCSAEHRNRCQGVGTCLQSRA